MARLTWQEVNQPNFSGANNAFGTFASMLQSAAKPMDDAIYRMQEAREQSASNQLMMDALKYQNPADMQAALASGSLMGGRDPRYLNSDALKMIQGQRGVLLGEDQQAADIRGMDARTTLTGAQTEGANLSNQRSAWLFDNEQDQRNATLKLAEVESEVDRLARSGDMEGAQRYARANAGWYTRAGKDPLSGVSTAGSALTNQQGMDTGNDAFAETVRGYGLRDGKRAITDQAISHFGSYEDAFNAIAGLRGQTNEAGEVYSPEFINEALAELETKKGIFGRASTPGGMLDELEGKPAAQGGDTSWVNAGLNTAANGPAVPTNFSGGGKYAGQAWFEDLTNRVIQKESGGNANAVNSSTGASGAMQVMPDTAKDPGYGVKPLSWDNRFNAQENIRFGRDYLAKMIEKYPNDIPRALAAYNWGPGNADKWDGNLNSLPAETRDYILTIMGNSSVRDYSAMGQQGAAGYNTADQIAAAGGMGLSDQPAPTSSGSVNQSLAGVTGMDPAAIIAQTAAGIPEVKSPDINDNRTVRRVDTNPTSATDNSTAQALADAAGEATPEAGETAAATAGQSAVPEWFTAPEDGPGVAQAAAFVMQLPRVDPNASGIVQARQQTDRKNAINSSVDDLVSSQGGTNLGIQDTMGATMDYLFSSPETATQNAEGRAAADAKRQAWNSPQVAAYLRAKPEELAFARAKPDAFIDHFMAGGVSPTTAAGAGSAPVPASNPADQLAQAAETAPETPSVPTPQSLYAQQNGMAAPLPSAARNVEAAFSAAQNTIAVDSAMNRYASIDKAFRDVDPENPLTLTDATRLYIEAAPDGAVSSDNIFAPWNIQNKNIQDELKYIKDTYGFDYRVGVEILKEIPPEAGVWRHGSDHSEVDTIARNYVRARSAESMEADNNSVIAPGVTRGMVRDEMAKRRSDISQLKERHAQIKEAISNSSSYSAADKSEMARRLDAEIMRQLDALVTEGIGLAPYTENMMR